MDPTTSQQLPLSDMSGQFESLFMPKFRSPFKKYKREALKKFYTNGKLDFLKCTFDEVMSKPTLSN